MGRIDHDFDATWQVRSTNFSNWYVAETLPRSERVAQTHLERQGFASFCPRFRKARRHARRVDTILAPVFPGYIFVRFNRDREPWRSINGTFGVKRLVTSTPTLPQAMPEDAMQALLARCEGDVISRLMPSLETGMQVRLTSGPFVDQVAAIEQFDDQGRVRVLLNILGATRSIQVHERHLEPS